MKIKGISRKYLNENELWDTYWLKQKYPERFITSRKRNQKR